MTLQDFIVVWQAQPFRAFRLYTERDVLTVTNPLAVAFSPRMQLLIALEDGRGEKLEVNEIKRAEVFGEPISLADLIGGIDPAILVRNTQLMAAMQAGETPETAVEPAAVSSFDPGRVSLLGAHLKEGIYLVQATVATREGHPILSTAGTRWNLHGVEQFENGTSLYLHHLDDPTVEERVIVWPPDKATLNSFAEAKTPAALMNDLGKRDERLTAKPVKPPEPPAAYFRKILREYPSTEPDERAIEFGVVRDESDFDRFEIHLVARQLTNGVTVQNPCLVDVPAERFLFDLTETDWDATFERGKESITLILRYPRSGPDELELTIDPYRLAVRVKGHEGDLPLGFVENELRNYALYEVWNLMADALRAGPDRLKQPNLVLPLAQGFTAELWAGETIFPLPFLQPRFLAADEKTLLDFRATPWAAALIADQTKPTVMLRLWSNERTDRCADPRFDLQVDLVTHRVTCRELEGATTLGMIQAMIRRVRGIKWLTEELPKWMEKGRSLPAP